MGATDPFEGVVDELYGVDPREFVAVRDQRAAQARDRGEKHLAARIRKLRKPTTAAALVNGLARHRGKDVAALAELGDRLRRAHRDLDGDRLRELTHERNDRVRDLVEKARSLASGAVGETVAQEVAATLEAAVGDEDSARVVIEGRLTSALSPPDVFGAAWLPAGTPRGTAARGRSRARRTRQEAKSAEPTGSSAATEHAEPTGSSWRTRRSEATEAAAGAQSADSRRREAEVRARRARDEARKELRAAEREEAKARRRADAARAAFEAAEHEVRRHTR
ncbi:hypothetical protein [Saccharomonospora xinjiangensis]|uniref:Uncharacterized protein n=1 Tax=Saccharomonospora xinjiangensis XJ-54 TaxID=882086 RepID=I0V3A5_9PSEU|nr:hypothetical protein [Saccharomonospora xinjiangensis]EID54608.1 hypothetical protein SacxiDRAFT_2382 [Saccharomonospora xinjiangensis XJ-54]